MTDTETKLADALRLAREYVAELLTEREAMFAGYGSMDEIRTVRETLAEVDEALAAHASARAQPASAGPASVGADVYLLARRCLWIAFVWNDHNFDEAHVEARKEAARQGIHSFSDANVWLDSLHVHSLNTAPQPAKEADR